ncbi:hypothetical protein DL95DRAFT_312526 [Leptodontidium sp. 2 PMI_412]|nr:hypothetical protein DL95DRAFT_312526 [Leptodontidium sp. 2 PMI_412]
MSYHTSAQIRPTSQALPSKPPMICIPTALSGGEYNVYSGVTNHVTNEKMQFSPPLESPSLIVLFEELACSTPSEIWLQSGMRGMDHCVETLMSMRSTMEVDESVLKSLKCLILGLLLSKKLRTMYVMLFLHRGVNCDASHGVEHMLGPMGRVNHGQTSCILLLAVCKFNALHNGPEILERQKIIRDTLWGIPEAKETFERRGLKVEKAGLGDLLDTVVRALGLERRLSEVGVERNMFKRLAQGQRTRSWKRIVSICRRQEVLDILEMCA